MLLLVPSHKTDDDGTGKDSSSSGRVLVVLPSDTDLSSNIVVPDTAITTTLGTNDTLENVNQLSATSPFSNQNAVLMDLSMEPITTKDRLGILQSSGPPDQIRFHQSNPIQQSNIQYQHRSPERQDDNCSRGYYLDQSSLSDDHHFNNRSRRHSHTGLVDGMHGIPPLSSSAYARSRSRSRQSMSQVAPYQYQPVRTPRAMRSALRKARKDQSPLLTSSSFGSDYTLPNLTSDLEDDSPSSLSTSLPGTNGYGNYPSLPRTMDHIMETTGLPSMPNGCDASIESYATNSVPTRALSAETICTTESSGYNSHDKIDSIVDIGVAHNSFKHNTAKAATSSTTPRIYKSPSETLDVDGISDEEMSNATDNPGTSSPAETTGTPESTEPQERERQRQGEDIDIELNLDSAFDADMAMILGMASDMELVMPQFDDEYLEDLKSDRAMSAIPQNRCFSSASVSSASPSCPHSSSTTITYGASPHSSPITHASTPCVTPAEIGRDSLPVSPNVLATRHRTSLSPSMSDHRSSGQQELSRIHKDIVNLKRHRDSLKQSTEMVSTDNNPKQYLASSSSSSSSSPSSSSSGERKSNGHIYFKPSHHSLPPDLIIEQHPRQNGMVIQSNQWRIESKDPTAGGGGARGAGLPPQPLCQPRIYDGPAAVRSNSVGGNHIFRLQESSPPIPPPLLDKTTMPIWMTANRISQVTANMNILTPQEVQEDYYARRNLRIHQQRQLRRRGSSAAVGMGAMGFGSGGPVTATVESMPGFSPLARRYSSFTSPSPSFGGGDVHPLDKPVIPAIGASPLPASYYIPPSAFRTEAVVAAEKEAERKRKEQEEEFKESFLVFPSPTLS
ncbi:hypothetical protein EDD21DRAFT_177332 [Dissophora ornata]|nr:hypothetical protein EDD21DRAFT_177332 [Dissophora ornata]